MNYRLLEMIMNSDDMQIDAFDGMVAYLEKKHFNTLDSDEIMSFLETHGDIHITMGYMADKHLNNLRDIADIERAL
jgi:hypothetical protein